MNPVERHIAAVHRLDRIRDMQRVHEQTLRGLKEMEAEAWKDVEETREAVRAEAATRAARQAAGVR